MFNMKTIFNHLSKYQNQLITDKIPVYQIKIACYDSGYYFKIHAVEEYNKKDSDDKLLINFQINVSLLTIYLEVSQNIHQLLPTIVMLPNGHVTHFRIIQTGS